MSEKLNGIAIKRVTINDNSQLPKDFCTTPGGTFFSTTPGGTRIIYDRSFLLSRKDSPLAKSPPANLPYIPEITLIPPKDNGNNLSADLVDINHNSESGMMRNKKENNSDDTFEMDI